MCQKHKNRYVKSHAKYDNIEIDTSNQHVRYIAKKYLKVSIFDTNSLSHMKYTCINGIMNGKFDILII